MQAGSMEQSRPLCVCSCSGTGAALPRNEKGGGRKSVQSSEQTGEKNLKEEKSSRKEIGLEKAKT